MRRLSLPTGLPVGDVNVYLDTEAGRVRLVDTGPDTLGTRKALERGLQREDLEVADIDEVWITHPHVDHLGLAPWIHEVSGARVLGSPETVRWLASWEAMWAGRFAWSRRFLVVAGAPPDVTEGTVEGLASLKKMGRGLEGAEAVDDGDVLGGRRVVRVDGHSSGQLAFLGDTDVLTGDHLIRHISSNPIIEPPDAAGAWPSMLTAQIASLKRSSEWTGCTGLSGHGRTIEDVAELSGRRVAEAERRSEAVWGLVDGRRSLWDIAWALFSGVALKDAFLALSEVAAHLFHLRDQNRVALDVSRDVWIPKRRD